MRLQVGPEPSDMKTATLSVSTPEQKTFDRGEPFATSKREWPFRTKNWRYLNSFFFRLF